MPMEELRADWKVPSIAHYCEMFEKPFRLPKFDVDELEEAIIASGSADGSTLLTQLFIQLLKGCYPHRGITVEIYLKFLHSAYKHHTGLETRFHDVDSPAEFHSVPQHVKVELLYMLCHVRLSSVDVSDLLKGFDGDSLRLEPIGTDSSGSIYWHFDATRLYKEDPPPPKPAPAKKSVNRWRKSRKRNASSKKHGKESKAREQRESKSLGNVANSNERRSARLMADSQNLRTRSMHSFGARQEKVASAIHSDSSDESPSRKRVKNESDASAEIHASVDKTRGNNENSVITAADFSAYDDFTPRRSSRTRSATSCYQAEPMKKEEPSDQDISDSDSNSDSDADSWCNNSQKCDVSGEGSGRWHLVCESVADWVALSDRFNKSSVACERKLYRRLTTDLIPLVEGLFEEKEKMWRKRLLEDAPRRTSGRLVVKRHLHDEEEKYREQLIGSTNPAYNGELRERRRLDDEEHLRMMEEDERTQREERESERERARNDRMRRAELRELRASLIAQGKPIPPELFETAPGKEPEISESYERKLESLRSAMERVHCMVRERKDAWPFRHPVDCEYALGYQDVVKHPMDLATMNDKLKAGAYTIREQFIADFQLMFENCRKYNGPNSNYTAVANKLERFVDQCIQKQLAPEESSSDDDSSSDSSSSDENEHYKDDTDGRHFQPAQYVQAQRWTSSLRMSPSPSLSAEPSPTSSSLVHRPCYARSYSPRPTVPLKGSSTIITIRRMPDSTPPTKFYAGNNTSTRPVQPGSFVNLSDGQGTHKYQVVATSRNASHPALSVANLSDDRKYQVVAVPATGFITDVACQALPVPAVSVPAVSVPATTVQNTVQNRMVVASPMVLNQAQNTVQSRRLIASPALNQTQNTVQHRMVVAASTALNQAQNTVQNRRLVASPALNQVQNTVQHQKVVAAPTVLNQAQNTVQHQKVVAAPTVLNQAQNTGQNRRLVAAPTVLNQAQNIVQHQKVVAAPAVLNQAQNTVQHRKVVVAPTILNQAQNTGQHRKVVWASTALKQAQNTGQNLRLVASPVVLNQAQNLRLLPASTVSNQHRQLPIVLPQLPATETSVSCQPRRFSNSCLYVQSPNSLVHSPNVQPRVNIASGHSPKALVDQSKSLTNGQVIHAESPSPRPSLANGQHYT